MMNIVGKLECLIEKYEYVLNTELNQICLIDDLRAIIEEAKKQEPVAYADSQAFDNFKSHPEKLDKEWMWSKADSGLVPLFTHPQLSDETVKDAARYAWLRSERNISNEGLFVGLAKHGAISRFTDHNADQLIDEAMKAEK
jgi:hypothetical protein